MRTRRIFVCVLAAVLLAGCRVEATTTTRMTSAGSGVVEVAVVLDTDAVRVAEAGGGKLESRVVTTDLVQAGWTVDPWERRPDGSARLAARKGFAHPQEVAKIYAEISGSRGPFRSVRATMRDGIISHDWGFAGTLDLAALNPGVTDDAQLAQRITAAELDPAKVQQLLAEGVTSSVTLKNRVELPHAAAREWTGIAGKSVAMNATSSHIDSTRASIVIGGATCIVLGLVLFLAGEARARRVRRRTYRR